MNNNQVLTRIQTIFGYEASKLIEIFALTNRVVSDEELTGWLSEVKSLTDVDLASFLNGLIEEKRGSSGKPSPKPEQVLNNNIVFKKLRIALNLQAEEIIDILDEAEIEMSKHELSALFRREGHKNFRECEDFLLVAFLDGIPASSD